MPHEDGAAYYPLVATVSLGSPIVLDIYDKVGPDSRTGGVERSPRFRILQEPRSLLITTKEMYTDYLHGIAERVQDEELSPETVSNWDVLGKKERYECGAYMRQTRVSLTYRDVLRVAKLGNSVKFLPGRR
jgi:alkylated DNA repair protein alkB homolog 6